MLTHFLTGAQKKEETSSLYTGSDLNILRHADMIRGANRQTDILLTERKSIQTYLS